MPAGDLVVVSFKLIGINVSHNIRFMLIIIDFGTLKFKIWNLVALVGKFLCHAPKGIIFRAKRGNKLFPRIIMVLTNFLFN